MRNINLLILSCAILLASCQKEMTKATSPALTAQGVTTTSTIAGVQVKKDGVPYPNISAASGFADDAIGWRIDLGAVSSGYAEHTPKTATNNLGDASLYCGGINTVNLYAGQNILMGKLEYANDANNLYVTYTTNPDWYMSEVHLYVGSLGGTPVSGGGTPSPGRFPIKSTFSASALSQSITYTIPLTSFMLSGFVIAAHAAVLRVDVDGDVVAKETAWAAGSRFQSNKNWATYIVGTLGFCGGGPADATKENSNN